MPKWSFLFFLMLATISAAGCAAPPTAASPPPALGAMPPPDFSIDVTVLSGAGVSPATLGPADGRFVLFADGSLHHARGASVGALPPFTRPLSSEQVQELWTLSRELGLADPDSAPGPVNLKLIEPDPGEVVFVVTMTGDGRRWSHTDAFAGRPEGMPPVERLTRVLADLAWAEELTPRAKAPPRRYDLGPDPYARYR